MKTTIYSADGAKKSETTLPKIFETKIREDIAQKYFEADKLISPYEPYAEAGKRHSASGTISHQRHDWKGHYGRGISRMPRKTMSRRGTQFFWIGAEVSGARGGRRAHPPKGIGKEKKINKKEIEIAMASAFAATANSGYIEKRYSSIEKIQSIPIVVESLPEKTKQLKQLLKTVLGENFANAFRKKQIRPGKGSRRGRKYKSNAGVLIITSSKENKKFSGIDIKSVAEVAIADLFPLGRLTIYTEKSLEEMK